MKVIGLDLSINSTGVCINQDSKCKYYIISSGYTKKAMSDFKPSKLLDIKYYEKLGKDTDYAQNETNKTKNLYSIIIELEKIIKKEKPDLVQMEGVSYGSTGSAALVDLSGLQFMVRQMLIKNNIAFKVVSPTQNKKFATGNGQADKDLMIFSWMNCMDKSTKEYFQSIPKGIKVDDIADAYFLSNYQSAS